MEPVRTEDISLDAPSRPLWQGLRDQLLSLAVVGAAALVVDLLAGTVPRTA